MAPIPSTPLRPAMEWDYFMTDRKFAPMIGPWTEKTNITDKGALYATFHIRGLASNLASCEQVMANHINMNHTAMQLAHPSVQWYQHFTRIEQRGMTPLPPCSGWFARRFDAAYTEAFGQGLYQNDLYFTVLKRPPVGMRAGLRYLFDAARKYIAAGEPLHDIKVPYAEKVFLDEFEDLASRTAGRFNSLQTVRLQLERRDAGWYNQVDEAYHMILNGFFREIPVSRGRASYNITPYLMKFGNGAFSIGEGPVSERVGAIYSLKNYPTETKSTVFDDLRRAPFSMSMTNHFAFARNSKALSELSNKVKLMRSSDDDGGDDLEHVKQAKKRLSGGHNVWGRHDISVAIHSKSGMADLDRKCLLAETMLSNVQMNAVRESEGLKAAFYAQMVGNDRWLTRPQRIPSEVYCDFGALHGLPGSRFKGRWGPPLFNIRSTADTEIHFHCHVQDAPQFSKEDMASMLLLGPPGTGKTGVLGTIATLSRRQNARVVICDKDRGLGVMVNANGGVYLVLNAGEPTGFAPLKFLSDIPEHTRYLKQFITMLIMSDGGPRLNSEEDTRLARAIHMQLSMPANLRSLAGIGVALGQKDREGARQRLRKWQWGEDLGWVADCPEDVLDMSKTMMGYDTTTILNDAIACGPVMNYIMFRTDALLTGRPVIFIVDEFQKIDQNKAFSADNADKLATIRKREGAVILATQSARTAIRSENSHILLQQTPTKILFADVEASFADLVTTMGLTLPEFHAVTVTLASRKHQFLVKRPSGSFIGQFDFSRRADQIAVISGRSSTYALMEKLKAEFGPAPEQWVPEFELQAPFVVDEPALEEVPAAAPVLKKVELVA